MAVTLEDLKADEEVSTLIEYADKYIAVLGYTEHGFRHANLTASMASNVLRYLDYPQRDSELAAISGYLHDIGNVTGREFHGIAGALIARDTLRRFGMPYDEVAVVINAMGSHEEAYGLATSSVTAALILGDKSDVHRSRVRNPDPTTFDIHDRVNYAAERSFLRVDAAGRLITLEIDIDTKISQVMEYFEIFLDRMVMARRAAEFLNAQFSLVINNTKLL